MFLILLFSSQVFAQNAAMVNTGSVGNTATMNYPNSMNYTPPKAAVSGAANGTSKTAQGGLGNCNLSPNPKNQNSVNDPFGTCGSKFGANSINNPVQCPRGANCPSNPFNSGGLQPVNGNANSTTP
jgi:hypothetical protein